MNRKEAIEKINKLIPNKELRDCIFCGDNNDEDDFLSSKLVILKYFSNIINFVFVFIYSKYKVWKVLDNSIDEETPTNLMRVFYEFEKLYTENPLNFDAIENILLDIQLDISTNGSICNELRLNYCVAKNSDFVRHAYRAKTSRKSYRLNDESTIEDTYSDLIDLISTFPFLRDTVIKKEAIPNAYVYDAGELIELKNFYKVIIDFDSVSNEKAFSRDLDTHFVLLNQGQTFYCLESIENRVDAHSNKSLLLKYWSFGEFCNVTEVFISDSKDCVDNFNGTCYLISSETSYEDYYYYLYANTNVSSDDDDKYRIKDFYSINFKFIKVLSLSLSDVVGDEGHKFLIQNYGAKYHFSMIKGGVEVVHENETLFYTWSEIIALLMINEGVSNIINSLVYNNNNIRTQLLNNLEFRFGKEIFNKADINARIDKTIAELKVKWENNNKYLNKNSEVFNTEFNEHKAEVIARNIVVGVFKAMNGNDLKETSIVFPASLRAKKIVLDDLKKSILPVKEKYDIVKNLIIKTIKGLYEFYYGFFGYAKIKKEFDSESFYKSLTNSEIQEFQEKAATRFNEKYDKKTEELNNPQYDDLDFLIQDFKSFCLEIELGGKEKELSLLKETAGKNKILDTVILDELSNFMHCPDDEDDLEEVIDRAKRFFTYLQTGKHRKTNINLGIIYPLIATCEYLDSSRDGNEFYHFSVVNKNGVEVNLRVLSEFTYSLNTKYFFLPNRMSSDQRMNIWIEPTIIEFKG